MPQEKPVLSLQLSEEINRVILSLKEKEPDMLDVDYISNVVQSRIDVHHISPPMVEYSSVQNLKQQVRDHLRRDHDPVKKAEDMVDQNQETLFDDILQDYYPCKREVLGVKKPVYVRRDLLTDDEVIVIAERLQKVSKKLAEHADALLAWNASR